MERKFPHNIIGGETVHGSRQKQNNFFNGNIGTQVMTSNYLFVGIKYISQQD